MELYTLKFVLRIPMIEIVFILVSFVKLYSCFSFVDITCPLPDAYSPSYVESAWYSWWEKKVNHFFDLFFVILINTILVCI